MGRFKGNFVQKIIGENWKAKYHIINNKYSGCLD